MSLDTKLNYGMKKQGKSSLMVNLINSGICPPMVVIDDCTQKDKQESYDKYKNLFPDGYIYNKFDQDKLKDIMNYQKNKMKEIEKQEKSPIISDFVDAEYDRSKFKSNTFKDLFVSGRHSGFKYKGIYQPFLGTENQQVKLWVNLIKEIHADRFSALYMIQNALADNAMSINTSKIVMKKLDQHYAML